MNVPLGDTEFIEPSSLGKKRSDDFTTLSVSVGQ